MRGKGGVARLWLNLAQICARIAISSLSSAMSAKQ
jgi:hypothetical protein